MAWFTYTHWVDDALKSYTHEDTKIPFSTSFGDNSAYNGTLFKDTVHIGGAILEKAQFGVSEKTANVVIGSNGVDAVGLIGVGFEANEAGVSDGRPTYPNIVSSLRASGAIAARAFSLYINSQGPYIPISIQSTDGDLTVTSLDAATGSIIFGGVDSSLYTGPLITVPMIKKGNETIQREFGVSCTSLTSSSSSDSKNDVKDLSNNTLPAYALLDSGGEASQVPPDMFSAIQQDFGAVAGPDGHYYVPCDRANSTATVTFGFGGPNGAKIVTPAGAFVKANDPSTPEECGPSHCCRLSVSPTSDGITLGDDFLHSAYLVFDIDNEVVALAQANLEPSTERNLREITAGVNGIPGAGSSSDSSTAVGTASGAPVSATGGSGGTMTATGTQPPIAGHTSAADRARGLGMETLMMGAAVGVGVGVGALMW